jgi:hypothetical protein
MTLFAIETDNNITAFAAAEQIPEGQERFASEKELAKLAASWPADRLVAVWNGFAGVAGIGSDLKPVKKFTDRKTAIARIWKAVQKLDAPATPETAAATETAPAARKGAKGAAKKAKATKGPKPKAGAAVPREFSKKAIVLELIRRADGASIKEIQAATEWQSHSVRGFISGSLGKKMGLNIESFKRADGTRAYRAAE